MYMHTYRQTHIQCMHTHHTHLRWALACSTTKLIKLYTELDGIIREPRGRGEGKGGREREGEGGKVGERKGSGEQGVPQTHKYSNRVVNIYGCCWQINLSDQLSMQEPNSVEAHCNILWVIDREWKLESSLYSTQEASPSAHNTTACSFTAWWYVIDIRLYTL